MSFAKYTVTLTGQTPLLMHYDNLEWADQMTAWKESLKKEKKSVAGDDRSPAWRWIGSLYVNEGKVCIPSDNLMTMIREGGSRVLVPGKKTATTFKRQTQSGLVVDQVAWPIVGPQGEIPFTPIKALIEAEDFAEHTKAAEELGFMLFVKRAKIAQQKHVRVRPRFDAWEATGSITVFDEAITHDILQRILTDAGNYCGLGDWRPSSPKAPGSFGKFTAEVS